MDRILAQAQQLENAKNNLSQQFNDGFDINKQIYSAKAQALQSAKNLGAQLVGQERLESAIGLAPIATKVAKVGARAVADPSGTAQAIQRQVGQAARRTFTRSSF